MSSSRIRKRVGIQIIEMGVGYSAKIWPGAVDCAESRDVDLIMFPGHSLEAPYDFIYQFNAVYQMMNQNNLDALILNTSALGNHTGFESIQKFCNEIKNIPLVSVGIKIPGTPSIVIDNTVGIKEMVRHLVQNHQARKIAFVRGPVNNYEAEERFKAFTEEMASQNLVVDNNLIAQGDFSANCVPITIDNLLKKSKSLPDAIMFANME